jgi:hypothetical protein
VPRASCPRVSSSGSFLLLPLKKTEEGEEEAEGKMPSGRKGETPSPLSDAKRA